jgi:OTU domain-containing protein 5
LNKRKIFKSTNNQELNFREELKKIKLKIIDIKEDGNCLYRSISHQIYGNEEYYEIIKKFCLEYLNIESEFFGQFINGGIGKFAEYLDLKKKDGNKFLFL